MEKSILKLEMVGTVEGLDTFRTVFKTQHGRDIFLELRVHDNDCSIMECFYVDRNQGRTGADRFRSKPKKLQTLQFKVDELLTVIEGELDKKFYGAKFEQTENASFSLEEYLRLKLENAHKKYRFLIMVGDGDSYHGLPVHLHTRLKNKLHRSIYVELKYYKDGNGVVQQCHYYDREYKRHYIHVTPSMLTSCFFPYSPEGILNLLNHEICCEFTHMIVTTGIDIDSNKTPLCGAL